MNSNTLIISCNTVVQEPIYLEDSITSVIAQEGSCVTLIQQSGNNDASLIIKQEKGSKVINKFLGMNNTKVQVMLVGEDASFTARGLFLLNQAQKLQYKIDIEHIAPNCSSNLLCKGIVDDEATLDFSCRVMVHPEAHKTQSNVANKNLLLSDCATINTEPGMEIYADDVVCTHGATVGQLDQEALFYLRSRGIECDQAIKLLIEAFAVEIYEY